MVVIISCVQSGFDDVGGVYTVCLGAGHFSIM